MLRSGNLLLVAAAVLAFADTTYGQAQTRSSLEQDATAFGTRDAVFNSDLSPDGNHLVFVGAGPGRTTVVHVADLTAGTTKSILYTKGDPETLQWCVFASDTRLVCRFTAIMASRGGYAAVGVLIPASRMISLNLNGQDIKPLGQQSTDYDLGIRQFDGQIIDWLPGAGNDVLMTRLFLPEGFRDAPSNIQRTKQGVGVVRLNVETLSTQTVEPPRSNVFTWLGDGDGQVRLMGIAEVSAETYSTGRVKYAYRTKDSREWKPLFDYVDWKEYQPLAIDGTTNNLYGIRRYAGRWALSRISLDGSLTESVVAHDQKFDVDGLREIGENRRVIGYGYADDQERTVYFDPEYKSLATALSAALPKHPTVVFADEGGNKQKVILWAGSDQDPGRYYLYDKTKKSLGELVPVRPALADRELAQVRSISYSSGDGTNITAHLLLPVGKSPKNLPSVVLPGGETGYLDTRGFDWLAQFLAARGYAVIEPLYRGFAGRDDWFRQNGFKGWRTSVGDISAAARYLVQQGIADPRRLAIVGWSHGGYAALQSAATEPALYKAVVAIDPITDLAAYKEDWSEYTGGKEIAGFVGNAQVEGSPARRAGSFQAPVLLFHGTLDVNETAAQSRRMNETLKQAGKQSELVEFDGLDRDLEDGTARAAMLLKMGQLLDRTIGH